ncbi:MAG: glycosyltransferase family 4 protein [Armatimonadetes bacterium]|nr:glycosyltransferase family 4 protein [Armatimonadota bacterium]
MRIGYFGRPIGLTGGIGRYALQLLQAMLKVAPDNEYQLYTNRAETTLERLPVEVKRGSERLGRVLWEQGALPWTLRRDELDVYHSPDFTLPVLSRVPGVVTLHDLIFMKHPEGTSRRALLLYNTLTRVSAKRARRVIAISNYTAHDISATLSIPSEKIRVVYQGVNPSLRLASSESDAPDILESLEVPEPFVLFVGLLTPRKGVLSLIQAYELAHAQAQFQALVLVGLPGSGYDEIRTKAEMSPLRDKIRFLGAADDRVLAALYRRAAVFCLPSFHEGFGLPVLEAMLLGCPVVAADATSLPEVVGDAGLLFPAGDWQKLSESLVQVATDSSVREQLREKGPERAARFTWENTARETLDVYREATTCQ